MIKILILTELKDKVEDLMKLYDKIKGEAEDRNSALENTLGVSEKFWEEVDNLANVLKDLQETMDNMDQPALEPYAIREQQDALEVTSIS